MATKPSAKKPAAAEDDIDPVVAMVDVAMVRRAIEFSATKDVRYYLNGVSIQPSESGGVLVMASDGHTALVLHDPNGKADKPYILPFNKGEHAKALSIRDAKRIEVSKSGRVTVTNLFRATLFIHPGALVDGKFPDLTRVLGKLDEYELGIKGAFDPSYMQRAITSAGKGGRYKSIAFYGRKEGGDYSAGLFTTPNGFGFLMPLREEAGLSKKLTKDFGGLI